MQNFDTYIGSLESLRKTVIIDPLGKTFYDNNTIEGENIITILSEKISQEYLEHLQNLGISYLFAGKDEIDLCLALETLRVEFGIETLILEGGGIINGTFLKAGLINELSLLIYPGIDGLAGTSTIFDYLGKNDEEPAKGQNLELISSETLSNGIVWLRYKFHNKICKCYCMIDY